MPLPRYSRPGLSQRGTRSRRVAPTRAQSYAKVSRRARGLCELCGRRQDPLDPHHAFGRGHLPGIPAYVCEMPEMILGLCRACHDPITGKLGSGVDQELTDKAKHLAISRFCETFDLMYDLHAENWDDELRRIIREAGPENIST